MSLSRSAFCSCKSISIVLLLLVGIVFGFFMRNRPQKAFRPSNKVIQGSIYSWGKILIKRREVNILNKSLCFNRSDYSYNLLRIIGINPPFFSLDLSFHLIIGSNTVMGHSYIQHIRNGVTEAVT